MAGNTNLRYLMTQRENLIERWMDGDRHERTKILVQLMDIDEDIAKALKAQRKPMRRFSF